MQQAVGFRCSNSFAALPEGFHARLAPSPLAEVCLVGVSPSAARLLGVAPADLFSSPPNDGLRGHAVLPGGDPVAMCHDGHQFGHFVPQLGDGRAIILGESATEHGHWEVQLKGAGLTPFSCDEERRAVLRSTIRDYLFSEAMHGLGVPTSAAVPALRRKARDGRSRERTAGLGREPVVSGSS